MQKYFVSIFTDKKGYGLSQYNVEVCTLDEIMRRVRLGNVKKYNYNNIYAERSKAGKFCEKIKKKGPKIHYFVLKLYTRASKLYSWASKSGGEGGPGPPRPPHPDPLVISQQKLIKRN